MADCLIILQLLFFRFVISIQDPNRLGYANGNISHSNLVNWQALFWCCSYHKVHLGMGSPARRPGPKNLGRAGLGFVFRPGSGFKIGPRKQFGAGPVLQKMSIYTEARPSIHLLSPFGPGSGLNLRFLLSGHARPGLGISSSGFVKPGPARDMPRFIIKLGTCIYAILKMCSRDL